MLDIPVTEKLTPLQASQIKFKELAMKEVQMLKESLDSNRHNVLTIRLLSHWSHLAPYGYAMRHKMWNSGEEVVPQYWKLSLGGENKMVQNSLRDSFFEMLSLPAMLVDASPELISGITTELKGVCWWGAGNAFDVLSNPDTNINAAQFLRFMSDLEGILRSLGVSEEFLSGANVVDIGAELGELGWSYKEE